MAEALVSNITALLGGIVPIIMLRFMSKTGAKDFRVIVGIGAIVLIGVGLQYVILTEPRPAARPGTAIASDVSQLADDFERVVDELEYKLVRAPLPDDAEFHFPTWHYHYNEGYSYVEGYSEVVLYGNMTVYQYRARVQCSKPNTLYVSLLEGYFDYSFATDNSPHGSVTRVSIGIDNQTQVSAEKVRVADGSAIIPFSGLVDKFFEGVLLRVSLSAQVERFAWNAIHHSVIFDLRLFDWRWRECPQT